MGTSRNPQQMVAKVKALGTATERRQRLAINEGALAAKTIMLASAATKGITPASRIAGGRWNVRYDIRGTRNPIALVRYTGPFHLFENPTKPHSIAPRPRRRRRGGAARALTINGNLRASAQHPGTPGAKSFPAARVTARRRVPKVMAASMRNGWAQVLK